MSVLLIHPPLDDPTIPYHSTAYLVGHLRANGFAGAAARDLNIEFVDHVLREATIEDLYEEAEARLRAFDRRPSMTYADQEAYYGLLAARRIDPAEVARATAALRRKDTFLDYATYAESVRTLTAYMTFLGALSYPADTRGFMPVTRGRFSVANLRDLTDARLGDAVCAPFVRYFQEVVTADREFRDASLFGISIVYDHQMFHALHLARLLKRAWPDKKIVLGGTAITQMHKYLVDKTRIKALFDVCDAIVVGEGETAICEMASAVERIDGEHAFPNTLTYSAQRDVVTYPGNRYESVPALGTPAYDHRWELYLSPARGINYSPTRGCYWNRCTFCDYGLNTDKPTSPWRERRIEQVIADLRAAQQQNGIEYVYFAVDVMAPGYLERLSDAFVQADLRLRWAAELRMEKIFSAERARKMAKAGCVCVSFGMESGSQRILDLMDKGTRIEFMGATMKNFASEGIACQLMAFTEFPTETPEERAATYEFIREHADDWSAGGIGTFLLTGTAAVARDPAKYGITLIDTQDADVRRAVAYRLDDEGISRNELTEEADASFDESGGVFPQVFARPWAGGIDSLHTMIYYDTFGREIFKRTRLDALLEGQAPSVVEIEACTATLRGRLVECMVDLRSILDNRRAYLAYLKERVTAAAEPTRAAFEEWSSQVDVVSRLDAPSYWCVAGKDCVKLSKGLHGILTVLTRDNLTIGALLARLPEPLRPRVIRHLRTLEAYGFIALTHGGRVISRPVEPDSGLVVRVPEPQAHEPAWRISGPPGPGTDRATEESYR
jgi:anaerobic magnesium-protoporphyrin IX monomethyl ester cyclase